MARSGIAVSYGGFILSFLRNLHTIFHSISVYIPTNSAEHSLFSTPSPALLFVDFLMMAILTDVRCYLIVVLVCIYLIMSDVEHLFMCLLAICRSPLEKCICRHCLYDIGQQASLPPVLEGDTISIFQGYRNNIAQYYRSWNNSLSLFKILIFFHHELLGIYFDF